MNHVLKASLLVVCLVSVATEISAAVLDSTSFEYRYEGDHLPTNAADPGTAPEGNMVFDGFTRTGVPVPSLGTYSGSTGYVGGSGSGILNLTVASGGTTFSFDEAIAVDKSVGFTVEFRVKALSSNNATGGSPREGFTVAIGASDGTGTILQVGTDRIFTSFSGASILTGTDNSTDFVTYRMVAEGGSSGWSLYRNDDLLLGSVAFAGWTANELNFGDLSGAGLGNHQLDYLRVDTTGGYAPVPEPASLGLLVIGASLLLTGSRRLRVC